MVCKRLFLLDRYFCRPYLDYVCPLLPEGGCLRHFTGADCNGRADRSPGKEIMQGLVMAITGARKYFYIQTPYFLPTEAVLVAMQTAALAGVDVRLMLPYRADNSLTHLAPCSYLAEALRAGVKVYFYKRFPALQTHGIG